VRKSITPCSRKRKPSIAGFDDFFAILSMRAIKTASP
jgi:hypothetical protein